MMRVKSLLVCLAFVAIVSDCWAADPAAKKDSARPKKPTAADQFEKLKSLAGDWEGMATHGDAPIKATVTYKLTSAGSTMMETLFCGTDHEMVTMYHLHGDAVLLTHYCAVGNQPRMKAELTDDANKLAFKFLDGTNLDPKTDMHMHEAVIEFVGPDRIKSEWVTFVKGQSAGKATFDLTRKK